MLLVTAYPIVQAVYYSLFDYRLTDPENRAFVGLGNYGVILTDACGGRRSGVTVLITVVTVAVELVLGFALALVMNKALTSIRPVVRAAILIPYAVITVVSAFAWQFAFDINTGFVNTLVRLAARHRRRHRLVRRPWTVAVRDLPRRDLEDDAVHLAAAARRPGPGAGRAAGGGEGRRRDLVAAAVEGHDPEHEGRDHGRAAVPHAGRVPHLRQHLRDDRGGQRHRDGVVPRLPADDRPAGDRAGLGGLGAAVPRRRADRVRLHQGIQGRPVAGEGGDADVHAREDLVVDRRGR